MDKFNYPILRLLPSLAFIPEVGHLLLGLPRDHIIFISPFHPISFHPCSGGNLPPPLMNNMSRRTKVSPSFSWAQGVHP